MEFQGKPLVKSLLWVLSITFAVLITVLFFQDDFIPHSLVFFSIFTAASLLFVFGIWLIVITLKNKIKGNLRKFLMLTGICSAGIIVSILLHNLVYGLFIHWFGADFWVKSGIGDEPIFFILAVVVLPVGLIIGIIGSSIQLFKTAQ